MFSLPPGKVGASIILCDNEWLTSDQSNRNNTEQLSSGVSNRTNRIWNAGTTGNGTVLTFPRVFLLTYPVENWKITKKFLFFEAFNEWYFKLSSYSIFNSL